MEGSSSSSSSSSFPPPAMMTSPTSDFTVAPIHSLKEQLARESMSTEWTNEKHSLYLKSMEASFVEDLYNSFDLLGYQVENPSDPKSTRRKHHASHSPSGQFKVHQGGCWEKISFERNKTRPVKVDSSGVLLANPWIRHFRSSCGRQNVTSSTQEKDALAADISNYDADEVTDQNFVDEKNLGEKESQAYYHKRIRTSMTPTPSNDQVVPLDESSGSDVADQQSPL